MWNKLKLSAWPKYTIFPIAFAITISLMAGPANSTPLSGTDSDNFESEVASLYIPMTPENNRWAYDLINSDDVNLSGVTGSGIRIALLDNGIDMRDARIASKVVARFDATHSVSGQ